MGRREAEESEPLRHSMKKTGPVTAGFEGERRLQAQECRQFLETRNGKNTGSHLRAQLD